MPGADLSTCSTCHAPIRWVITEGGRRMPLDPDRVPDGNVIPVEVDGQRRARVLPGDQLPVEGGAWQSHHRSCPHAEQHRRRTAAAVPRCGACRGPLDPVLAAAGDTVHPTCGPPPDFRALTTSTSPADPDDAAAAGPDLLDLMGDHQP